jgi:hypothetical protein
VNEARAARGAGFVIAFLMAGGGLAMSFLSVRGYDPNMFSGQDGFSYIPSTSTAGKPSGPRVPEPDKLANGSSIALLYTSTVLEWSYSYALGRGARAERGGIDVVILDDDGVAWEWSGSISRDGTVVGRPAWTRLGRTRLDQGLLDRGAGSR